MQRNPGRPTKPKSEKFVKIGVTVPPVMRRYFDENRIGTTKFFQDAVRASGEYQKWLKTQEIK